MQIEKSSHFNRLPVAIPLAIFVTMVAGLGTIIIYTIFAVKDFCSPALKTFRRNFKSGFGLTRIIRGSKAKAGRAQSF